MNYSTGLLTTITLIAAFVVSGCENQSNKIENAETSVIEANRDLEIAKSEAEAELHIYRAENSNKITGYNRTIGEIKTKINNEPDRELRVRHEQRLARYEATNRDLKREMDNYQVSSRDNWDDFKGSFDNRMDDLGNSLNNFFSDTNNNRSTRTTTSNN